jgi:hypothetical protein
MLKHLERQTMATKAQKQELVDILKFTPQTLRSASVDTVGNVIWVE